MASPLPKTQTAIVARSLGTATIQNDAPLPALESHMVMIKTATVAINPVDVKALDYAAAPGAILGTDFAGTIVAVGDEVAAAGRLAVGDRVAGMVCGMNAAMPDVGAFGEYVGAQANFVLKLPDHLSFEDAAPLGLATATALYALFTELGLPVSLEQLESAASGVQPEQSKKFVLVAGGSTATGTRAIQLLKTVGLRPIATCSPANNDLVTRFGAEKVFDYHSPTCAEEIAAYTRRGLYFALDCVAEAETTQLCYASIGRGGGRYVTLEPFRESVTRTRASTVKPSWFNVRVLLGQEDGQGPDSGRAGVPEDVEFAIRAFAAIQKLLDRGLLDTHPVKVVDGGWGEILEGINQIRKQPPSGAKLVCRV